MAACLFAAALFTITSCKKSSSSSTTAGTGKPFYCKLNGTAFEPSGGGKYQALSGMFTGIQIIGDGGFVTTIEIYVPSDAVGTYSLSPTGASNFATVYVNSSNREYLSTSGEVKITKSGGNKISGTFHYSAADSTGTMSVTEGEFNDISKI
jgi:hypothetical protein